MRADWVNPDYFLMVLASMMPENRLALLVEMATGLRIGDVLSLRTVQLQNGQRFTVREQKTGKGKRVYLKKPLYDALLRQAGRVWVFPGRLDERKHRTRQAVWKDLKRCARLWRCAVMPGRKENWGTHTARKIYAVAELQRTGELKAVQKALNHSSIELAALYALADQLQTTRAGNAKKS